MSKRIPTTPSAIDSPRMIHVPCILPESRAPSCAPSQAPKDNNMMRRTPCVKAPVAIWFSVPVSAMLARTNWEVAVAI